MTDNQTPPDGGMIQKPTVYFDKFPIRQPPYRSCLYGKPRSYSEDTPPLGDPVCRHPKLEPLPVKMCPDDWLKQPRFDYIKEILDPDGWDRSGGQAFYESWTEEITAEEMDRRVSVSTVKYNYIPGVPKNPCAEIFLPGGPKPLPVPELLGPTHLDNVFGNLPRTPDGVAVQELHDRLAKAWTRSTSSTPLHWSPENPATGQCAVTAVLVHRFVGGLIIRGLMNHGRTHYWNISKTGETFDLTRDQFEKLQIVDATVVDPDGLLADDKFSYRYTKLLQNLAVVTIEAIPPSGGYTVDPADGDITVDVVVPRIEDVLDAVFAPGGTVEISWGENDIKPIQNTVRLYDK